MAGQNLLHATLTPTTNQNEYQMNSGRRSRPFREWSEYVDENRSAEYEIRDDYSHFEAMQGTDQGGDQPGAPLLPAPGGAGAAQALASFTKRHNKAHRWLCETQEDPRLRDLLRALPPGIVGGQGRARRAWVLLVA